MAGLRRFEGYGDATLPPLLVSPVSLVRVGGQREASLDGQFGNVPTDTDLSFAIIEVVGLGSTILSDSHRNAQMRRGYLNTGFRAVPSRAVTS